MTAVSGRLGHAARFARKTLEAFDVVGLSGPAGVVLWRSVAPSWAIMEKNMQLLQFMSICDAAEMNIWLEKHTNYLKMWTEQKKNNVVLLKYCWSVNPCEC